MYRVALCEDEQIFAEMQEKTCRTILEKLNIEYTVSVFASSTDFLRSFLGEGRRYDLIMLDILMGEEIDGIELARTIRESDEDAAIIFITSTNDYLAQGYDVNALHYLNKPLDSDKLEWLIARDYTKRFQLDFYVFDFRGAKRRVDTRDIVSMETSGRRVETMLSDGTSVYYSGKLTELLDELPKERFTRCHQSVAVNLDHVRELNGGDAIALNGRRIPVSRAYAKDVKKAFMARFRNK